MAICFWPVNHTHEKEKYGSLKQTRRENIGHGGKLALPIVPEMSCVTWTGVRGRCTEGLENAVQGNLVPRIFPHVSASVRRSWNPGNKKKAPSYTGSRKSLEPQVNSRHMNIQVAKFQRCKCVFH